MQEIAESLGAGISTFRGSKFEPTATHFLRKVGTKDNESRDSICASHIPSCRIVAPRWLIRCAEAGVRVDETDFLLDEAGCYAPVITRAPKLDLACPDTISWLRGKDVAPADPKPQGTAKKAAKKVAKKSGAGKGRAKGVTKEQTASKQQPQPPEADADGDSARGADLRDDDLSAAIAAVIARKKLAPISQNIAGKADGDPPGGVAVDGRKPPPRLGRAASSFAATSAATVAGAESSKLQRTGKAQTSVTANEEGDDDDDDDDDDDTRPSRNLSLLGSVDAAGQGQLSSQQVLYEDPELQAQRERVLRKMGATFLDQPGPERAKSTSMARDAGGIGTRTRQRRNLAAGSGGS